MDTLKAALVDKEQSFVLGRTIPEDPGLFEV